MPGLDLIEAVPLNDHNAPLRRGAFNGHDVLPRRQDKSARSFERFLHERDILFHVALEIGHLDLGDEKDWSGVLGAEPLDRGDAKSKTRQDGLLMGLFLLVAQIRRCHETPKCLWWATFCAKSDGKVNAARRAALPQALRSATIGAGSTKDQQTP